MVGTVANASDNISLGLCFFLQRYQSPRIPLTRQLVSRATEGGFADMASGGT